MSSKSTGPMTLHKYDCALMQRALADKGTSNLAKMEAARYFHKVLMHARIRGHPTMQQVSDDLLQQQGLVSDLCDNLLAVHLPDELQLECAHVIHLLTVECSYVQMEQVLQHTELLQTLVTVLEPGLLSNAQWMRTSDAVYSIANHFRQTVIDSGILPPLLDQIHILTNNDKLECDVLENALALMHTVCRERPDADNPPFDSLVSVLPNLASLLSRSTQLPDDLMMPVFLVLSELVWSTTHEQVTTFMDTVDCGLAVQYVLHAESPVMVCTCALVLLWTLLSFANNEQKAQLLQLNLLAALKHSISSSDADVRVWAFMALLTVVRGTNEQLCSVLEDQAIMMETLRALHTDCLKVVKECARLVVELCGLSTFDQCRVLITDYSLLNALIYVFGNKDWHPESPMLMVDVVRCLDTVLQHMHNPVYAMRLLVEPYLRDQTHLSAAVQDKCAEVLLKYNEASASPAPNAHNYYTTYTRPNHTPE